MNEEDKELNSKLPEGLQLLRAEYLQILAEQKALKKGDGSS